MFSVSETPMGSEYRYRYLLEGGVSDTENILTYNGVRERKITHDGAPDLVWTYTYSPTTSTIVNPDQGQTIQTFVDRTNFLNWNRGLIYHIQEPQGSIRKRVWVQNKAWGISQGFSRDPNNPYVQRETVTVSNASSQPAKTAVTNYAYDKNGNLLQRTEYEWVNYIPDQTETGTVIKRT